MKPKIDLVQFEQTYVDLKAHSSQIGVYFKNEIRIHTQHNYILVLYNHSSLFLPTVNDPFKYNNQMQSSKNSKKCPKGHSEDESLPQR